MELNIELIVKAAITAVGVIEWLKGFFPDSKVPTWVWRIAMAPVCVGLAFAQKMIPELADGLLLMAIAQIGYPALVQLPTALIEFFRKKLV